MSRFSSVRFLAVSDLGFRLFHEVVSDQSMPFPVPFFGISE